MSALSENSLYKSRSWLVVGGFLSVFVGFMAMSYPLLFSVILVQVLAAFALVSGVISLGLAIFGKNTSHRVLEGLVALVRIAAGIVLLACIQSSVMVITLIFAVFLIIEGVFFIIGAFKLRNHAGWIWTLISGIASLVLGILVYAKWPSDSTWILGLFFGINLLFNGISLLALGMAVKKPA